eukprot:12328928-Prorocentrum_lima.AAC.1
MALTGQGERHQAMRQGVGDSEVDRGPPLHPCADLERHGVQGRPLVLEQVAQHVLLLDGTKGKLGNL